MFGRSLKNIRIGQWDFREIALEDSQRYSEFIKATAYPVNLWSSNFAYLWAASKSRLRRVLWKVVDNMLVTFGYSFKNTLYVFCLPFGEGNAEKIIDVVLKCLNYCYDWNNRESNRTLVRMLNQNQLEFLRNCAEFDHLFRLVTLRGIERHLDIKKVVALTGKDFSTVRSKINKFHRENPKAVVRRYQKEDYDRLIELGKHWDRVARKKYSRILDKNYYRELINASEELKQIVLVMEKGAQIIGMVSGSELPTGQAWGGLLKYEVGIPGLSETLSVECARELNRINPELELINIGSDLGPGGLRDYKLKFRPVLNLKRYQMYRGK